jgi:hypothetical protein
MLHDQKDDPEFERAIEIIRKRLPAAKQRVKVLYPEASIRWIVETRTWVVVHKKTREALEASRFLDDLATGDGVSGEKPKSGTHRRTADED